MFSWGGGARGGGGGNSRYPTRQRVTDDCSPGIGGRMQRDGSYHRSWRSRGCCRDLKQVYLKIRTNRNAWKQVSLERQLPHKRSLRKWAEPRARALLFPWAQHLLIKGINQQVNLIKISEPEIFSECKNFVGDPQRAVSFLTGEHGRDSRLLFILKD